MWIAHKQIAEYLLKDSKYAFFFFLLDTHWHYLKVAIKSKSLAMFEKKLIFFCV